MIPESHPYWHVRAMVSKTPELASLSLSYYVYRPQSIVDERITWCVTREEFLDERRLVAAFASIPEDHELAFHSNVLTLNGDVWHLPMVDMSTAAKAHLEKLRTLLGDASFEQIQWYESGRSFHGYGGKFFSEREWVQFMGVLLLSNKPRFEPTVDPRWIGHRLLAGYSALRWSKNTPYYLGFPTKLTKTLPSPKNVTVGAKAKSLRLT